MDTFSITAIWERCYEARSATMTQFKIAKWAHELLIHIHVLPAGRRPSQFLLMGEVSALPQVYSSCQSLIATFGNDSLKLVTENRNVTVTENDYAIYIF